MKHITPIQLAELINSGASLQLIDVREPHEHSGYNIGGVLMPLSGITKQLEHIEKESTVVLYCRVGARSQIAIQRLQEKYPFKNLVNLAGGTEAWRKRFPS